MAKKIKKLGPRISKGPFIRAMPKGSGWEKKKPGQKDNITQLQRDTAIKIRKERNALFKDWYTPFLPRAHRKASADERARLISANVFGIPNAYQMAHEGDRGKKALFIKGVNAAAKGHTNAKKQLLQAQHAANKFANEMGDVMVAGKNAMKGGKDKEIKFARGDVNDIGALDAERNAAGDKKYKAAVVR